MENKREELIKFFEWYKKQNLSTASKPSDLIDLYLGTFIPSAPYINTHNCNCIDVREVSNINNTMICTKCQKPLLTLV